MKLFLATSNPHKVAELGRLLVDLDDIEVISADGIGGMPPVEETAGTFEGNAALKAGALWPQAAGRGWVVADDSGLEIDALGGRPGVYSSRYAGKEASDAANRQKLLRELRDVPEDARGARFVCVLVVRKDDGEPVIFRGACAGEIALEEEGDGGFGYDPVFRPHGYENTFGALPSEVKNRLSHRGEAVRKLAEWLRR